MATPHILRRRCTDLYVHNTIVSKSMMTGKPLPRPAQNRLSGFSFYKRWEKVVTFGSFYLEGATPIFKVSNFDLITLKSHTEIY
ncbi:hypothetical protein C0J52_00574 [Blattella germanica]|nr:hypothetical protein C0J52_00574 [Blattella germanica]